jgi:hypothetical protein
VKRYSVGAIGMMEADADEPDSGVWVKAEVARAMYEALKAIIGFFESGEFVRDTSRDFEQGWHLKMLPVVKSIADAQAALKKAEAH